MSNLINYFNKGQANNSIDNSLYDEYNVKKGLRNEDGTGVLVGLTKISDVVGYKHEDGNKKDARGELFYRGINVQEIIDNGGCRFLFEEICFLILFGYLPSGDELDSFKEEMASRYALPDGYLQSKILGYPAKNILNKIQQEVLAMYTFDEDPDNIGVQETLDKGLDLICKIPYLMCYSYQAKKHHYDNKSLVIHQPVKHYSIAENILRLLRDDKSFTKKEAEALDIALVLHADHGGGNNSTFTNIVISSTGTDIYSSIAGAIGSLKGPKHGGANIAVVNQMKAVFENLSFDANDEQIKKLIYRILDKDFNDNSGLVYGIGHAVYTLSDPRCQILSKKCHELSIEKGREKEYEFYKKFEQNAIEIMHEKKGINVCANIDFYSGFLYDMLKIPEEIFTLLFVTSRTVGWVAHNVENKLYSGKIIRPASKYVGEQSEYQDIKKR